MPSTKLFRLLTILRPKEWEEIGQFLSFPFVRQFSLFPDFWSYLKSRKEELRRIKDQELYEQFYPENAQAYISRQEASIPTAKQQAAKQNGQLRRRQSELHENIEQYLSFKSIQQNSQYRFLPLMEQYKARRYAKGVFELCSRFTRKWSAAEQQDLHTMHLLGIAHRQIYQQRVASETFTPSTDTQELHRALHYNLLHFLLASLSDLLTLHNRKQLSPNANIYTTAYDYLLPLAVQYRDKHPLIEFKVHILELFRCEVIDIAELKKGFSLFANINKQQAGAQEQNTFLIYLNNLIIRARRQKVLSDTTLTYKLYQLADSKSLLTPDGIILSATYVNVITLAAAYNDNEYLRDFIQRYKRLLLPKDQDVIGRYSQALLNFNTENYSYAFKMLYNRHEGTDYNARMRTKVLQLRCLYFLIGQDIQYGAIFEEVLERYLGFIQRDRQAPTQLKEPGLAFGRLLRQIKQHRYFSPLSEDKIRALQQAIETARPFYKDWLLEIIRA